MRRVTCWTDVTSKAKLGETFIHVHCTHTKSFPSEENVVLIITHRHLLLFNLDDGCSIFVDHSHSCTKALNFKESLSQGDGICAALEGSYSSLNFPLCLLALVTDYSGSMSE